MWLLHVKDEELQWFNDSKIMPKYAILSHVWDEDEIRFQEMPRKDTSSKSSDSRNHNRAYRNTQAYRKMYNFCTMAAAGGYEYVWTDTCCIDKTNSVELSESINSMFRWYAQADVCYAYLGDCENGPRSPNPFCTPAPNPRSRFGFQTPFGMRDISKWLTRGWTLQELIAPEHVNFYDKNWQFIGSKAFNVDLLHSMTRIPKSLLSLCVLVRPSTATTSRATWVTHELNKYSAAARLSWASLRETTREEDRAYCLLGLLDVSMPLTYGEKEKAFRRLQAEVIRTSNDLSILAPHVLSPPSDVLALHEGVQSMMGEILAPFPAYFHNCDRVIRWPKLEQSPSIELTSAGVRLSTYVQKEKPPSRKGVLVLNCGLHGQYSGPLCLPIIRDRGVWGPASIFKVESNQDASRHTCLVESILEDYVFETITLHPVHVEEVTLVKHGVWAVQHTKKTFDPHYDIDDIRPRVRIVLRQPSSEQQLKAQFIDHYLIQNLVTRSDALTSIISGQLDWSRTGGVRVSVTGPGAQHSKLAFDIYMQRDQGAGNPDPRVNVASTSNNTSLADACNSLPTLVRFNQWRDGGPVCKCADIKVSIRWEEIVSGSLVFEVIIQIQRHGNLVYDISAAWRWIWGRVADVLDNLPRIRETMIDDHFFGYTLLLLIFPVCTTIARSILDWVSVHWIWSTLIIFLVIVLLAWEKYCNQPHWLSCDLESTTLAGQA